MTSKLVTIEVDAGRSVSGLLQIPAKAFCGFVLAHGAGAGMTHPFMAAVADGLGERGVATLRYQFPYMEHGLKRPDRPALAHVTVRAAVAAAIQLAPPLPLFAGGKSFGARMTSQAQAAMALPNVRGLAFIGFPLHPAKQPSDDRASHLSQVQIPMLFVQGTRDALAEEQLLIPVVQRLGQDVTLMLIDDADHSFHVPRRSGRTDAQALGEVLDALASWFQLQAGRRTG